jgi:hypothetical protein
MSIPKMVEVDCSTGIETVRDFTEQELEALEQVRVETEKFETAQKAEEKRVSDLKNSAKYKLVNGQPLTPEEASVLVI